MQVLGTENIQDLGRSINPQLAGYRSNVIGNYKVKVRERMLQLSNSMGFKGLSRPQTSL